MVVKEIRQFIQLASQVGWKQTIAVFFLIVVLPSLISGGLIGYLWSPPVNTNTVVCRDQNSSIDEASSGEKIPSDQGKTAKVASAVDLSFNMEEWSIDKGRFDVKKRPGEDSASLFCVKKTRKFDSAQITYARQVPINTEVNSRFLLSSEINDREQNPKIYFSYGEPPIFRIFLCQ